MITHSSKTTETGYEQPIAIRLPLIIPQTADNPRRQINKHEVITVEHLAELGLLPAAEPPTLAEGQKYDTPQLVDGVVSIVTIDQTATELLSTLKHIGELAVITYLQERVSIYNEAHGLVFQDVHACANYKDVIGYTHKQFCEDVWAWNVAVWEEARLILADIVAGERLVPTIEGLIAELPMYEGVE